MLSFSSRFFIKVKPTTYNRCEHFVLITMVDQVLLKVTERYKIYVRHNTGSFYFYGIVTPTGRINSLVSSL